jgi:hypothetical protein
MRVQKVIILEGQSEALVWTKEFPDKPFRVRAQRKKSSDVLPPRWVKMLSALYVALERREERRKKSTQPKSENAENRARSQSLLNRMKGGRG